MKSFKKSLMSEIKFGRFDLMVKKLLSNEDVKYGLDIKFMEDLKDDPDPINRQKRINLYMKKRDMIMRLAEARPDQDETSRMQ